MEESWEVSEVSEKIEQFWRDADGADVMRVMDGETVEVRVRDSDREDWRECEFLGGFHCGRDGFEWKDCDGVPWQQCQVYDPPAWYINKPDPGEGYRLLEKFPPEELQPSDEWFESAPFETGWKVSHNEKQGSTLWYRRRIANNPETPDSSNSSEVPNSCRSRDTIPSGWRVLGEDDERLASDAFWSRSCKEWIVLGDDWVGVANREKLHAIRQVVFPDYHMLRVDHIYGLPNGSKITITAKGFEVG
jgi:hypothetical protein